MYRTGDLGRMLADGNMEFLGRKDHQVKIRGFRVELGEIENQLLKHTSVKEAVVDVKRDHNNNNYLCAYIVEREAVSGVDLKAHLSKQLPAYMLPSYFIKLDKLPLTSNGKINRKALPAVEDATERDVVYEAPVTVMEKEVAQMWQDLLGVEKIGLNDNFLELGAHSLNIGAFINRVHREYNVLPGIEEVFSHPTIKEIITLINEKEANIYKSIVPVPLQENYEISHGQRRLWILDKLVEDDVSYNIGAALILEGELDREAFEKSLHTLIERHESLRTVFIAVEGELRQQIRDTDQSGFTLLYHDLRGHEDMESQVVKLIEQESGMAFNLGTGPLLRAQLIQRGDKEYIFLFTMHHIISDGWSMMVLVKEVLSLYGSYSRGLPNPLPALPIQYKDYAGWQNSQLVGEKLKEHQQYWLDQFKEELPVLELPTDYARPLVKTSSGSVHKLFIGEQLSKSVQGLSLEKGVSLFTTLVASIKALLYRYTGQEDIVIGTPIAGREHSDLEEQIGFYINTLGLRTHFKGEESFEVLLGKEKETVLGALAHQIYPFDKLVDELGLSRDMSRSPVFDVMVVLQNIGQQEGIGERNLMDNVVVKDYPMERVTSKFDLTLNFQVMDSGLEVFIEYNTDLFTRARIERLGEHYKGLLYSVTDNPKVKLGDIQYLTSSEEQDLEIYNTHSRGVDYPWADTLVSLFEKQVHHLSDDHIAVIYEGIRLTYKELNVRSNQLAHLLREAYQVEPDTMIGIMVSRSVEMIIGIMGILKSGGCYVPIDKEYPEERKSFMLSDTGLKILVVDSQEDELKYGADLAVINLRDARLRSYPVVNPIGNNTPSDLAYIIYTSGSTGVPKGVMIEHRNVVRLLHNDEFEFSFTAADTWTLFHSICFDFSVWEIFGSLLNGSKLVVVSREQSQSPALLADLLAAHEVTVLNMIPSVFSHTISEVLSREEYGLKLRYVIFGGEALKPGSLKTWIKHYPQVLLINMYGITETTVHVTYKHIGEAEIESGVSNIGKPIPTLSLHIMDDHRNLMPVGTVGEIVVGGAGVARGYLNRESLTQARFITTEKAGRLYCSGDLGIRLESGDILYLGRKDHQVKVNGYRIELGEIENALLQHTSIREAAVLVKESEGIKYLAAYIKTDEEIERESLRGALAKQLPEYVIPSHYIKVSSFPSTSSGKIDRKALSKLDGTVLQGSVFTSPENELEEKLSVIWKEILRLEQVSTTDNYFSLGGDSIKAIRLISRINKDLSTGLKIGDLFRKPTIRDLALYLPLLSTTNDLVLAHKVGLEKIEAVKESILNDAKVVHLLPKNYEDIYPLVPIESGMIYSSLIRREDPVYFDQFVYYIGYTDEERIKESLEILVERHSILRTRYYLKSFKEPVKIVLSAISIPLSFEDISSLTKELQQAAIRYYQSEDLSSRLSFDGDLLWRIKVFILSPTQSFLVWSCHHAMLDGWSVHIFNTEIGKLIVGGRASLPPLLSNYKDYCAIVLGRQTSEGVVAYWRNKLEGYTRSKLPFNYTGKQLNGNPGMRVKRHAGDQGVLHNLARIAIEQRVSLKSVFVSGYVYLMHIICSESDIVTGVVYP